ncbi:hypothetical protein LCGC14_0508720 [marine sediment metagenome]|uniref:Glycosyl transferase family 1 domain-containing protein n=1 Tax=marine sediment metagenome TaxID=412755 RepID=A0A0F9VA89_9ZZZZ
MIIFLSDLDLKGSGYMNIALALCNQLVARGKKVTALGIGYTGEEHHWPFSLLPVQRHMWMTHAPAMMHNLHQLGISGRNEPVEAVVIALDIPLQIGIANAKKIPVPHIGIFPVEDGPICQTWAMGLGNLNARLVISEHGKNMLEDAGAECEHIRIGLDTKAWRMPIEGEKRQLRKSMGFEDEDFVIVTVADNQERKNLSATMEIIAKAREKYARIHWILVTRKESPVGWRLDDLALKYGMTGNFVCLERGISFAEMWRLVALSNLFMLTSKAEGLGMPAIEAMAAGVPVLATHAAALIEHIFEDAETARINTNYDGERGFTIPVEFTHIDVWGNSRRSYVDVEAGAAQLLKIIKYWETKNKNSTLAEIITRARLYAEGRNWDVAGILLEDVIDREIAKEKLAANPVQNTAQQIGTIPSGVPQPVPPIVEDISENSEVNQNGEEEKVEE